MLKDNCVTLGLLVGWIIAMKEAVWHELFVRLPLGFVITDKETPQKPSMMLVTM